ncbi:membrane metallo-endopeptidase-like 1 [Amblyomma americanum]
MASGVGGALSCEPKKQEDVIVTVASTQPSSAPGMTSTKKGAAETSVAYPQSADTPPCDPAPTGLVSDAAPARDPASLAKGSKVRSPRETFGSSAGVFMKGLLTSLVVIATMLFVLVAIFFLIRTTTPKVNDGFCVTDDCLFHASLLKETRGTKFDPCNDFSAHVCFNRSPPKQREDIRDFDTSAMVDMVYSWLLDLSTTLQEGSKAFPVANKALAMLESCMSNASTYGTDLKNFRKFLNNLSLPWPNPPRQDVDALGVLVNLAYNWQAPFWFEFAQHSTPVSDSGLLVARYGDRRTARSLRPAFCGFHIEVPYRVLLLSLRFASRLTQSDKELVDAGFDRLVSTAVYLVNDSTWLDSESGALATDKLRAACLRLRPPAKFLNDTNMEELFQAFPEKKPPFGEYFIKSRQSFRTISRKPDFETIREMPEYFGLPYFEYDYVVNALGVAIGALNRPLFYSKGTLAMFYGGFGFSVAIELVKALDQEELQWHPDGRLVDSFLSVRSHSVFEAKTGVLTEASYAAARACLDEIPAFQIALSAFLDAASEAGNTTQISTELNEEKVFFMTICHMTCTRQDVKKPFSVDCNKLVRHSAAFAKAFHCTEGSMMNPENKCSFFD